MSPSHDAGMRRAGRAGAGEGSGEPSPSLVHLDKTPEKINLDDLHAIKHKLDSVAADVRVWCGVVWGAGDGARRGAARALFFPAAAAAARSARRQTNKQSPPLQRSCWRRGTWRTTSSPTSRSRSAC